MNNPIVSPSGPNASTTQASATGSTHGDLPGEHARTELALALVWSKQEPQRVGEVAFTLARTSFLGRSTEAEDGHAIVFQRQRPGGAEPTRALLDPAVSRQQVRIERADRSLRVARVGRRAMTINGVQREQGELVRGDTLGIDRAYLFLVVERPLRIPGSRFLPSGYQRFVFGGADPSGGIGESYAAWTLRERLGFAASTDAHVLLLGPSGSGKELAARALHEISRRKERAFVRRNATTLPDTLLDAELFGNTRNYPNPGMPERAGLVGEADGGTLFLDEIAEMPHALQAHLLRLLDRDGEYQRLGEARVRRADLRVVAATNRPLSELKADLGARFTVHVEVPPLASRPEDVPLLAQAIADEYCERLSVGDVSLHSQLVDALVRHHFELNVRELEQLVVHGIGEGRDGVLRLTDSMRAKLARPSPPDDLQGAGPGPTAADIESALQRARGNVTRAARTLGLANRYALYRLMKRHGIERGG